MLFAAAIMQSGGDMRPVHNSVDTVNAAAVAIVTAESRTQPPAEQVRAQIPYYCMVSFLSTLQASDVLLSWMTCVAPFNDCMPVAVLYVRFPV